MTTHLGAVQASAGTYNLGAHIAGKSCWLQGIGGSFRNNDPNDGVIVRHNTTLARWELVVSPGKIGRVECNI